MNKRERIGTHVKEEKNCVRFCGSETDILHRARNKLLWTSIFWTSLLALQRIMHMLWLFARQSWLLCMYLYCTAQPPLMAAGKCRHATWIAFFPSPPVTVGKASRRRWGEEDFFWWRRTYVRTTQVYLTSQTTSEGRKGLTSSPQTESPLANQRGVKRLRQGNRATLLQSDPLGLLRPLPSFSGRSHSKKAI